MARSERQGMRETERNSDREAIRKTYTRKPDSFTCFEGE
jgi:hypothetical protein